MHTAERANFNQDTSTIPSGDHRLVGHFVAIGLNSDLTITINYMKNKINLEFDVLFDISAVGTAKPVNLGLLVCGFAWAEMVAI
jgi:hypothetical protein